MSSGYTNELENDLKALKTKVDILYNQKDQLHKLADLYPEVRVHIRILKRTLDATFNKRSML